MAAMLTHEIEIAIIVPNIICAYSGQSGTQSTGTEIGTNIDISMP